MKLKIEALKLVLLNNSTIEIQKALTNFDINAFDKHGNNILHYYVKTNMSRQIQAESIIQLFIDSGINIDAQQQKSPKRTALELAVVTKSKNVFNILIEKGTNPNITDEDGNVALFHAVMGYRGDDGYFIETLIAKGAIVDISNNYGVSPKSLSETVANYDSKKFFNKM
jgi:ankyrin repeat protein